MFLIIALIAPFQFLITPGEHLQLISALYDILPLSLVIEFYIGNDFINNLPFSILRFVFAVQVGRYYKYATSKARTIAFGIISEIPSVLLTILYLLQPLLTWYPLVIGIPLPITFGLAWMFISKHPRASYPLTWKGEKKILDWWPEIDDPEREKEI